MDDRRPKKANLSQGESPVGTGLLAAGAGAIALGSPSSSMSVIIGGAWYSDGLRAVTVLAAAAKDDADACKPCSEEESSDETDIVSAAPIVPESERACCQGNTCCTSRGGMDKCPFLTAQSLGDRLDCDTVHIETAHQHYNENNSHRRTS
jgi:hypothetical protein